MEHFISCAPEKEGLSSKAVLEFIDFFEETRANMHSFILMRNGKIITEAYYKPFDVNSKKRLYSCTKTIVSLAIGRLVGEGLVSLDAPVVSYFPKIKNPAPKMAELTVRQTLMMTPPKNSDSYVRTPREKGESILIDTSWAEAFFSDRYLDEKPCGKLFVYDSSGSTVLGDLVYNVTGKTFVEYLKPVFDEIGVSPDVDCVMAPSGMPWGASGFLCTLRDFAKIGELVLNKGNYRGKQLISKEYMEEATSKMVDTMPDGSFAPDRCGYGYQIWQTPQGYALIGLGGQYAICFPEKNFMFVCQSNNFDTAPSRYNDIYFALSRMIRNIGDEELPLGEDYEKLCDTVSALSVNKCYGKAHSSWENKINGKRYVLNENPTGISEVSFDFNNEEYGVFNYVRDGEKKSLKFGYGKYVDTFFPESHYYYMTITKPGGREFRALSTGSWTMEDRLLIATDVCDVSIATTGFVFEFFDGGFAAKFRATGEDTFWEYNGTAVGTLAE